ncbi:MAG TPA: OB-fold domain-containing protein [Candidatus Binatia bacterium]|nr:OB-fold domain-containing protein [Candidatus Binatia bacterium]
MSEVRRPERTGAVEDRAVADLHPDYPLPDVDHPVTKPFWDGCRERRLVVQRDRETGAYHWPPKPAYWKGGRLDWVRTRGTGTIYTYVVGHEPFLPAFRALLPLPMVVVELDEGPRLVGYMVSCRPEDVAIGKRVRVVFRPLTERVTLPVWELAR